MKYRILALAVVCGGFGLGADCWPTPVGPTIKSFEVRPQLFCPAGDGAFGVVWTTDGDRVSLVLTDSANREHLRRDNLPSSGQFNSQLPSADRTPGQYSVVITAMTSGGASTTKSKSFEIVGDGGTDYRMTLYGTCTDRCIGFGFNQADPSDLQNRFMIPSELLDPKLITTRTALVSAGTSHAGVTIQSFAASHATDSMIYCNNACNPPHEYPAPLSWRSHPSGDYLFNGSFSSLGLTKADTYSYVVSIHLECTR